MSALDSLDLSSLAQFRASDLLAGAAASTAEGVPMQVALPLIDFDPSQPRRKVDDATIAELAASIQTHGVLEPVSLRRHPEAAGRYIVNRGERRVRAARRAGLQTVPAFLDDRVDPFAQAAENLHRESMSPFDLALFIAEREREGHSRAEIARRLNKPRSFITEAACLIDAPAQVRSAFEAGRVGGDTRVLYQLAAAMKKQPAQTVALLEGSAAITRGNVDAILGRAPAAEPRAAAPSVAAAVNEAAKDVHMHSAGRTVLVVEHGGRRGSLRLKAHDNDLAEIRFGDGSRDLINLKELRLVCWATEE
jgi:ParB family chromosome partitioning protein